MKYIVTLEFKVKSIDLLDVEVEASSKEEAIRKAEEHYIENPDEASMYDSKHYESSLDTGNMDVEVEENPDETKSWILA